jgi:hypothetical protein
MSLVRNVYQSTGDHRRQHQMLLRIIISLSILAAGAISIQAQSRPAPSDSVSAERSAPGSSSGKDIGAPEDEMRARNEIRIAEKERQENLDRAREAAQLGDEIRQAFSKNKVLGSSDMKKLERIEKLARRIRSRAGGSDDDEPLENVPTALETALNRLADTSEALSKGVEKTPKMVISTSVIERANELLELIRFIRSNAR